MSALPADPLLGGSPSISPRPHSRRRRTSSTSSGDSAPLLGTLSESPKPSSSWRRVPTSARARHSFGMFLLAVVVILWVSSNFLTYAIFSDNTYSKPYFITFINTSVFSLYLIPSLIRGRWASTSTAFTTRETLKLSAEFCLLWFIANYFSSYCLAFTSVASATILSSTSAMFTLLFGAMMRVERFSYPKLLSVIASLLGIALISTTDLAPPSSSSSPTASKTPVEILLGDAMALLSAGAYATYITLLKRRVGSEDRVDMRLFFGFVGVLNVLFLWPGLVILHHTGLEPFELPGDGRVWAIVAVNASITLVSDFCWAYAMLLTTPLVVTVGLSLTIPVAMVGEMVLRGAVAGGWYWVGAGCVFVAFWGLNREEAQEREGADERV